MPDPKPIPIQLPMQEVYPLLCPKCQLALKKLLGEKLAEKVMEG